MGKDQWDRVAFAGLLCSLVLFQYTWAVPAPTCNNDCRQRTSFNEDVNGARSCTLYSQPDCEKCVGASSYCTGTVNGTYCDPSEMGTTQIKFQNNCPDVCPWAAGKTVQATPGVDVSGWSDPVAQNVCFI